MLNRLQLVASIISRDPVRYTPSGIPIVSCVLQHKSEAIEAGFSRHIELTISALAVGDISSKIMNCELDVCVNFDGFLARKHYNANILIFHITELLDIEKINDHGSSH
ncbi:primosomal replication protein N [Candidatus Vallotia lariciata]|uniref:primosomal replication protein N n=1 Tax=Candidatus Vallotia laricis TaxID=2018052 RepID=UPI001D030D0F|nr:primosomal replication protein N [Candidatus Vallotia lariciata]UDG83091.1 Primosomal replication protein N [Candidatus Vallotia lariciata]